jgi:hypothetical protein
MIGTWDKAALTPRLSFLIELHGCGDSSQLSGLQQGRPEREAQGKSGEVLFLDF